MKVYKKTTMLCAARPDEAKFSCCNHADQGECPTETRMQNPKPPVAPADERPAYYHREIF